MGKIGTGRSGVGVIGCGMISEIYCRNIIERFGNLELVACADRHIERAEARALQFDAKACAPEELLADPGVDIVLNLTLPASHGPLNLAAIAAGKHVYSEKPLAADFSQAKAVMDAASAAGLRVGCAPDTFLGGGLQTCRKLLDEGRIGEPIGAAAFCMTRGPEISHPNPAFLYRKGAGPLFDLGPYFLTALITLLGPVARVAGFARRSSERRIMRHPENYGTEFDVEAPTYVSASLEFERGIIGSFSASFDCVHPYADSGLPFIQIYGTEGTLSLPDPNRFEGPVLLRSRDSPAATLPLTHGFTENCRGIGLSEMAQAIGTGAPHRAGGELALHVVDVMEGILDAAASSAARDIRTRCGRPEALAEEDSARLTD